MYILFIYVYHVYESFYALDVQVEATRSFRVQHINSNWVKEEIIHEKFN